jgi:hypothetical protein
MGNVPLLLGLGMVVEADGQLLLTAGFLRGLAKGAQTGFGCADGGQNAKDTEHDQNPHTKVKFCLQPYGQYQKENSGKNHGKAKLAYPYQQIQYFHGSSGLENIQIVHINSKLLYLII